MEYMKELKENKLHELSIKLHFYHVVKILCVVGMMSIFGLTLLLYSLYLSSGTMLIGTGTMDFIVITSVLLTCIILFSCVRNSMVCKKIKYWIKQ